MNVNDLCESLNEYITGDGITLAVIYTGKYKKREGLMICEVDGSEIRTLNFDLIGPVSDPKSDTLRLINLCEEMDEIVVIREIRGSITSDDLCVNPSVNHWLKQKKEK